MVVVAAYFQYFLSEKFLIGVLRPSEKGQMRAYSSLHSNKGYLPPSFIIRRDKHIKIGDKRVTHILHNSPDNIGGIIYLNRMAYQLSVLADSGGKAFADNDGMATLKAVGTAFQHGIIGK